MPPSTTLKELPATTAPATTAPDKYQEAIEYLIDHPDEILAAWFHTAHHPAGCLFRFVTPNGRTFYGDKCYGCLTTIRGRRNGGYSVELTTAIRSDDRIPMYEGLITLLDLPVFAEWQRRLDTELQRT